MTPFALLGDVIVSFDDVILALKLTQFSESRQTEQNISGIWTAEIVQSRVGLVCAIVTIIAEIYIWVYMYGFSIQFNRLLICIIVVFYHVLLITQYGTWQIIRICEKITCD